MLIVTITLASAPSKYSADGYCWLSVQNGIIWGFAGPVIFIIMVSKGNYLFIHTVWTKIVKTEHNGHIQPLCTCNSPLWIAKCNNPRYTLLSWFYFVGEYIGINQGCGHHHLHSQEKVHHVGHGSQSGGASLWTYQVPTTRRHHLSSFFFLVCIHLGRRPWNRQAVVIIKWFCSAFVILNQ